MRRILRRPSPALVVATIALFLAAGGTTYALTLPANSVGSAQIQAGRVLNSKLAPGSVSNSKMGRNAVTFSKLASNQMTAAKIRNASLLGEDLAANTVTGAQIPRRRQQRGHRGLVHREHGRGQLRLQRRRAAHPRHPQR